MADICYCSHRNVRDGALVGVGCFIVAAGIVSLLLFTPGGYFDDLKYNQNILFGSCLANVTSNITLNGDLYQMGAIFTWIGNDTVSVYSDLLRLECHFSDLKCFQRLKAIENAGRSSCWLSPKGRVSLKKVERDVGSYWVGFIFAILFCVLGLAGFLAMGNTCYRVHLRRAAAGYVAEPAPVEELSADDLEEGDEDEAVKRG